MAHATVPGTATAQEMWQGAMTTLRMRQAELADGKLVAPAAEGTAVSAYLSPLGLTVEPPCKYCSFGVICGVGAGR